MSSLKIDSSKAVWTDELRKIFLDAIREEMGRGTFTDSGFKATSWTKILSDFNIKADVHYTKDQIQTQYSQLKSKYSIFRDMIQNSGFGWDSVAKLPTAPEDVWTKYLESHKDARPYRHKTLMFYDELEEIFAGKCATGKYARSSLTNTAGYKESDFLLGGASNGDDDKIDIVGFSTPHSSSSKSQSSSQSSSANSKIKQESSSGEASKRQRTKRTSGTDQIVDLVSDIASVNKLAQEQSMELNKLRLDKLKAFDNSATKTTVGDQAISLFTSKFANNRDGKQCLKVKRLFATDETEARLFCHHLNDDERDIYLEELLYTN